MSASPAVSAELAIPADRILRELSKSAQPGFYGQTEISIMLIPKALEGVVFIVAHNRTLRATNGSETVSAAQQDTDRERAVQKVVDDITNKLHLRAEVVKIVGHYKDGHLLNYEIVDEHRAM
jgi:hypothetical protein